MATTFGPDIMLGAPPSNSPDDATTRGYALPTLVDAALHNLPSDTPQASPRTALPPPNPHFVFPARPSSSSAPSSFSKATGRRPRSAIEAHESALMISTTDVEGNKPRSPALPSFSFNPGAALPPSLDSPFLVPPQSPPVPDSPRSIPIRPASHRRGGSEFVGGKIRSGDAVTVLSTSPTKSENGMPSPMLQPARPNRPRGHAHRRSAAISSHDLSSIILPSPGHNLRGSSAPASPALLDVHDKQEFPAPTAAPSEPKVSSPTVERPVDTSSHEETPIVDVEAAPKPIARNRVGFSDTLEFIPRPLSLVSNETSSTVTARPGHSLSGSISSVISLTNPDRDLSSPLGFSATRILSESRPSTAGAVLERTQSNQEEIDSPVSPRRRGSIPCLGTLPPPPANIELATPSPTKSSKKWSFFSLEPFAASPTRLRPLSAGSSESQKEAAASSSRRSCEQVAQSPDVKPADVLEGTKPLTKKRSKKQKKVKTWAGSILSRKSKARHGKQKRRTPTPPPLPYNGSGVHSEVDDDTLDMAAEPEIRVPSFVVTGQDGEDDNWASASAPDEDASYPMIDLDAALGPFNTPLPRNPEWEAAQRAGGHVKKQLHSAAGMSRFTGPGMHYHHRRAESAPEMVPFDAGRLGFPRFGSSSTMADVFEEDEEDDDSAGQSTGQSTPVGDAPTADKSEDPVASQSTMSTSPEAVAARPTTSDGTATTDADEAPGIHLNDNEKFLETPRLNFNRSTTSLQDDAIPEDHSVFTFASAPRKSIDSAAPSPRQTQRPKDLAPVDVSPLNLPTASLAPISPYSMTQSSAFPSPRSPMSYDAHRISTAPSSITEDNFQSLLMGEPGPEVRISVDDIPSLTSSNSTMTRESLFAQHARFPPASRDQPRPASFTSTAFGRRRSSLASLSRLISSSHGERSKLSMEVPMDNEPEKTAKSSKTKRLSRLMQFWKAKDDKPAQC